MRTVGDDVKGNRDWVEIEHEDGDDGDVDMNGDGDRDKSWNQDRRNHK